MQLTNAWLGFDLPYEEVEANPAVKSIRKQGITKRIPLPEHHVTVGYFGSVDIDALSLIIKSAEQKFGSSISATSFTFDGYGVITGEKGKYIYFSPAADSGREAFVIREALCASSIFDASRNCTDLHLSIGGADPFVLSKPRQNPLPSPLLVNGRLILVGCPVGAPKGTFVSFPWDSANGCFVMPADIVPPPTPTPTPLSISRIAIFPKIQPDTAAAVYLLKNYGEEAFPGAANAEVIFMSAPEIGKTPEQYEAEGTLLIDLAGSRFDHHISTHEKKTECASSLVAKYLGVANNPELKKLLSYAMRDDLEGKGTISSDPLDRAFGLSGILMSLNRVHNDNPQAILDIVLSIFSAHVYEEWKRTVEMPAEWRELRANGIAKEHGVQTAYGPLLVVSVTSDNISLPGFIRAYRKADVVVQRQHAGHTNILTQQSRGIDLRPIIARIRMAEAEALGVTLPEDTTLDQPGRLDHVPHWYYDTAANTLQNGGVNPRGITPTALALETITTMVIEGLNE